MTLEPVLGRIAHPRDGEGDPRDRITRPATAGRVSLVMRNESPPGTELSNEPVAVLKEARTLDWLALCGLWVGLNAFSLPENFSAWPDVDRWRLVLIVLWSSCLWIAMTPALFWVFDRVPLVRGRVIRNGGIRLLTMGGTTALLGASLVFSVRALTGPLGFPADTFRGPDFPWALPMADAAASVGVAALAYAWLRRAMERRRSDRRAASLENALLRARLHALTLELQPHFLFNTLNGIAELIREAPATAESMLIRLSELLRVALAGDGDDGITLGEELRRVGLYMDIQRMRLGDRVTFKTAVEPAALSTRVPTLLLQPLVENAITHGVGPRVGSGEIDLQASVAGDRVTIRVIDNGVGVPAGAEDGVGLSNSRARIEGLFGAAGQLRVLPMDSRGTEVRIEIPYDPVGSAAGARRDST